MNKHRELLPQNYKHFLDINHFTKQQLEMLVDKSIELKNTRGNCKYKNALDGKSFAMIFEKLSLRTRLSFEVGISELGGNAIFLNKNDIHLGEKESIQDTAKMISAMAHGAIIRCYKHNETLIEFAKNASVPTINALTDYSHPCQIVAALSCFKNHFGDSYKNKIFVWLGAYNNVLLSYIHAASVMGFILRISCPKQFTLPTEIQNQIANCKNITFDLDPNEAAIAADVIITDTWVSMGDNFKFNDIKDIFASYQVNASLMSLANRGAIFSHCLPAIRGQEVTSDVIDGPQSVVVSEAEFRLHSQKAILLHLFDKI